MQPSKLSAPPHDAVPWIVSEKRSDGRPRRSVRVRAQLWYEARQRGAAALGVPVEQVSAEIVRFEVLS